MRRVAASVTTTMHVDFVRNELRGQTQVVSGGPMVSPVLSRRPGGQVFSGTAVARNPTPGTVVPDWVRVVLFTASGASVEQLVRSAHEWAGIRSAMRGHLAVGRLCAAEAMSVRRCRDDVKRTWDGTVRCCPPDEPLSGR